MILVKLKAEGIPKNHLHFDVLSEPDASFAIVEDRGATLIVSKSLNADYVLIAEIERTLISQMWQAP